MIADMEQVGDRNSSINVITLFCSGASRCDNEASQIVAGHTLRQYQQGTFYCYC
jgi:hypothetical protein